MEIWLQATYTAKPQNLCIHGPSVSHHISTGTLAIENAAFLTIYMFVALSNISHVSLLPLKCQSLIFSSPNFDDGAAVSSSYKDRRH